MLAKLTSKNQLTLPKAVFADVEATEYFEVEARGGQIVLTPVRIHRSDSVRSKLAELGLTDADLGEALAWARQPPQATGYVAEAQGQYTATAAAPAKPARKTARKPAARR